MPERPGSEKKRPNILMIMTDQHRYDRLSCLSELAPSTPNIDLLASEGVVFHNAYAPSPVCSPARAAIKSGMYPPGCGVVGNWMPFKPGTELMTDRLRAQGYQTAMSGKLHFVPHLGRFGFDWKALNDAPYSVYAYDDSFSDYIQWLRERWEGPEDPVALFDEDENAFKTDEWRKFIMGSAFRAEEEHDIPWTTDEALRFLDERDEDKPFYMFVSYFGPHQPFDPPEPWASMYSADDIQLPPQFEADMRENPVFMATCEGRSSAFREMFDERAYREMVAAYYGQIAMIDHHVGRLFARLKQDGQWENTVVVFVADHGDHNGAYGLFFKGQMYDSCCRVPLLIKAPGLGSQIERPEVVNSLDLYGTILELAGDRDWDRPEIEARSLVPLLGDEAVDWRNETYSIIGADASRCLTMLRREDLKLIRLGRGQDEPLYELYDMSVEPLEIRDIFQDEAYREKRDILVSDLDNWVEQQASRYPVDPVSYHR